MSVSAANFSLDLEKDVAEEERTEEEEEASPLLKQTQTLKQPEVEDETDQLEEIRAVKTEFNAGVISIGFFFIFAALGAAINYATSREGHVGESVLGVLYVFVTVSSPVAAPIVSSIGPRQALILGGCTYVVYILSNVDFDLTLVFLASMLLGTGAAVLWTAQGVYMNRISRIHEIAHGLPPQSTKGYFNGIFWSVFSCSVFLGNGIIGMLFALHVPIRILYFSATMVAVLGVLLLCNLQAIPNVDMNGNVVAATPHNKSLFKQGTECFSLLKDGRMRALVVVFLYWGAGLAFVTGLFPLFIKSVSNKFYALAVLGFSGMVCSLTVGKISDRFGRLPVLFVAFACHLFVYHVLLHRNSRRQFEGNDALDVGKGHFQHVIPDSEEDSLVTFATLAAVRGLGDACINTQMFSILGFFFEEESEKAYALAEFFKSVAVASAFFFSTTDTSGVGELRLLAVLCIVSVVILTYIHMRIAPLN